ncbi:hypothetical protein [Rhodoferax sp.]|uniref:hypothetical protein n=1 Tax=Rhodoferax sp. TaxID=50421 RepID=UPI00374D4EC0
MQSPETKQKRNSFLYFGAASLLAVSAATAQVTIAPLGIDVADSYSEELDLPLCWADLAQQDDTGCQPQTVNLMNH